MRVFLSWSGETSRSVAAALKAWIPNVLQAVLPWMSEEDISAGARWSSDLGLQLESQSIGIICLTPENMTSPWLMFEAGALSKSMTSSKVIPYLFRVEPTELIGPLVQFQSVTANESGTEKVIATINDLLGESRLPDDRCVTAFRRWWPDLDKSLKGIPSQSAVIPKRTQEQILEEILTITRRLDTQSPLSSNRYVVLVHASGAFESEVDHGAIEFVCQRYPGIDSLHILISKDGKQYDELRRIDGVRYCVGLIRSLESIAGVEQVSARPANMQSRPSTRSRVEWTNADDLP